MCLAIPGRIASVDTSDPIQPVATVDFEGRLKTASLLYVPEAQVGDYVIVQSGFAIRRMDEAEALEALALARDTIIDGTPVASSQGGLAPTPANGRS